MRGGTTIIAVATLVLVVMAIQYPLSTTFPIGGDAASYVTKSRHIQEVWQSRYPTAQLILTSSALLPLSWPDRFIWIMSLGHMATGLALGFLVFRLTRDTFATAAALFFWGLSITGIQRHFEDGTLAQLWSLPWLLLWLESIYSRAWKRSYGMLLATITTHPFSGLLVLLTSLLFLMQLVIDRPAATREKKQLYVCAGLTILLTLFLSSILLLRPTIVHDNSDHLSITEAIRSAHGALLLLAPVGILYGLHTVRSNRVGRSVMIAWVAATSFFAFNDRLNIGVETNRFATYFFLLVTFGAAVAAPYVLRHAIPLRLARRFVLTTLAGAMFLWTWSDNAAIYNFYESPSRYARLHRDEQAAFTDLKHLLPANSVLTSSEANRHVEWLPILTGRTWYATPAAEAVWHGDATAWRNYARERHFTHFVSLKHTEEPPEPLRAPGHHFPKVYENNAVIVYQLL